MCGIYNLRLFNKMNGIVNMRWVILLVLTGLLLAGCDAALQQQYRYIPPKNAMDLQCVNRCQGAQNYCSSICELKNPRCYQKATAKGMAAYAKYQKQQLADNRPIQKMQRSFIDTSHCRAACHCITAYNTCYSACGGQVIPLG